MRTSIEYWTKRALLKEKRRKEDGEKLLSNLQKEYNKAFKDFSKQIESWHQKYADENGITLVQARKKLVGKEQRQWENTMEDFLSKVGDPKFEKELRQRYIKSRVDKLESIQNQVAMQLELLTKSQNIKSFQHLKKVYENSYYETLFDGYQAGIAVRFDILDPKLVESICRTPWSGKNFSERIWTNNKKLIKEVRNILSQGAIQGLDVQKMSRQLSRRMDVALHRAKTLIRTETNFLLNQATAHGYEAAGLEEYQFLATLDTRTSVLCQRLDNRVFKSKEKMVGVNYPPIHPNCRSTTVPYFREDEGFRTDQRFGRDYQGRGIYVDAGISYKDWYNEYIKPYKVLGQGSRKSRKQLNPPKYIETVDVEDIHRLEQKLNEYEDSIAGQDFESAYVVDQKGEVYRLDGESDTVDISLMEDKLEGSLVTHNHPDTDGEIGGSFSKDDILAYFAYKMKELRAVDSQYRYSFKSSRWIALAEIEQLLQEARHQGKSRITIEDMVGDFDIKHHMNKVLSELNKDFIYERVER